MPRLRFKQVHYKRSGSTGFFTSSVIASRRKNRCGGGRLVAAFLAFWLTLMALPLSSSGNAALAAETDSTDIVNTGEVVEIKENTRIKVMIDEVGKGQEHGYFQGGDITEEAVATSIEKAQQIDGYAKEELHFLAAYWIKFADSSCTNSLNTCVYQKYEVDYLAGVDTDGDGEADEYHYELASESEKKATIEGIQVSSVLDTSDQTEWFVMSYSTAGPTVHTVISNQNPFVDADATNNDTCDKYLTTNCLTQGIKYADKIRDEQKTVEVLYAPSKMITGQTYEVVVRRGPGTQVILNVNGAAIYDSSGNQISSSGSGQTCSTGSLGGQCYQSTASDAISSDSSGMLVKFYVKRSADSGSGANWNGVYAGKDGLVRLAFNVVNATSDNTYTAKVAAMMDSSLDSDTRIQGFNKLSGTTGYFFDYFHQIRGQSGSGKYNAGNILGWGRNTRTNNAGLNSSNGSCNSDSQGHVGSIGSGVSGYNPDADIYFYLNGNCDITSDAENDGEISFVAEIGDYCAGSSDCATYPFSWAWSGISFTHTTASNKAITEVLSAQPVSASRYSENGIETTLMSKSRGSDYCFGTEDGTSCNTGDYPYTGNSSGRVSEWQSVTLAKGDLAGMQVKFRTYTADNNLVCSAITSSNTKCQQGDYTDIGSWWAIEVKITNINSDFTVNLDAGYRTVNNQHPDDSMKGYYSDFVLTGSAEDGATIYASNVQANSDSNGSRLAKEKATTGQKAYNLSEQTYATSSGGTARRGLFYSDDLIGTSGSDGKYVQFTVTLAAGYQLDSICLLDLTTGKVVADYYGCDTGDSGGNLQTGDIYSGNDINLATWTNYQEGHVYQLQVKTTPVQFKVYYQGNGYDESVRWDETSWGNLGGNDSNNPLYPAVGTYQAGYSTATVTAYQPTREGYTFDGFCMVVTGNNDKGGDSSCSNNKTRYGVGQSGIDLLNSNYYRNIGSLDSSAFTTVQVKDSSGTVVAERIQIQVVMFAQWSEPEVALSPQLTTISVVERNANGETQDYATFQTRLNAGAKVALTSVTPRSATKVSAVQNTVTLYLADSDQSFTGTDRLTAEQAETLKLYYERPVNVRYDDARCNVSVGANLTVEGLEGTYASGEAATYAFVGKKGFAGISEDGNLILPSYADAQKIYSLENSTKWQVVGWKVVDSEGETVGGSGGEYTYSSKDDDSLSVTASDIKWVASIMVTPLLEEASGELPEPGISLPNTGAGGWILGIVIGFGIVGSSAAIIWERKRSRMEL